MPSDGGRRWPARALPNPVLRRPGSLRPLTGPSAAAVSPLRVRGPALACRRTSSPCRGLVRMPAGWRLSRRASWLGSSRERAPVGRPQASPRGTSFPLTSAPSHSRAALPWRPGKRRGGLRSVPQLPGLHSVGHGLLGRHRRHDELRRGGTVSGLGWGQAPRPDGPAHNRVRQCWVSRRILDARPGVTTSGDCPVEGGRVREAGRVCPRSRLSHGKPTRCRLSHGSVGCSLDQTAPCVLGESPWAHSPSDCDECQHGSTSRVPGCCVPGEVPSRAAAG